jgi:hypothetical protein
VRSFRKHSMDEYGVDGMLLLWRYEFKSLLAKDNKSDYMIREMCYGRCYVDYEWVVFLSEVESLKKGGRTHRIKVLVWTVSAPLTPKSTSQ